LRKAATEAKAYRKYTYHQLNSAQKSTVSIESDCNNSYCNNSHMSVYWKLLMVNLSGNFRMPWTKTRGAQDWPNSGSDTSQTRLFCKPEVHAVFQ